MVFLLALLLSTCAQAQNKMEKLNFLPNVKSFATLRYEYEHILIEANPSGRSSGEIISYSNLGLASLYYQFFANSFLGVTVEYGVGKDNGPRYGVDENKRFASQGFREPELNYIRRLREQKDDRGNIDLLLNYLHHFEEREVGFNGSNRMNGRNELHVGLSHGYHEGEWEFRTQLIAFLYGKGKEQNEFTSRTYTQDPYRDVLLRFNVQYEFAEKWYLVPGLGVLYRGTQRMDDGEGNSNTIQSGSGSLFELGLKRLFGDSTVVTINSTFMRHDYFVKATEGSNFDGKARQYTVSLMLQQAF